MRWFQYKILNRILYMTDSPMKFQIVENEQCAFCNNYEETIMHVFCYCPYSNVIWAKLEKWVFS